MKILFIAFPDSIHTARWINQITDQNWKIYLFPSNYCPTIHRDINYKNIFSSLFYTSLKLIKISKKVKQLELNNSFIFRKARVIKYRIINRIINRIIYKYLYKIINIILIIITHNLKADKIYNSKKLRLLKIIKKYKPDIIHSLETQHAGYLTLDIKKDFKGEFPTWIHTNWGSDIYLFGQLSDHEQKIKDVLSNCDYYSCECHRDLVIARKYGFKGKVLPVFPNTGGFDLDYIMKLKKTGLTSERKIIMLKGYQNWAGRALSGLRALERCGRILNGFTIVVYLALTNDVQIKAELISKVLGIPVKIISDNIPHEEILKLHGQARISIGLSISDAISTSLLEAMVMGSFPIQSWTSCADEWIKDNDTGILVPSEDPEIIEKAIRRALTDDKLVDDAAIKNWELAKEKLDKNILKLKTIEYYNSVKNVSG